MGTSEELRRKITDGDLRQFAESDSEESRTEIVVLDVPVPQVKFRETFRGGTAVNLPSEVMPDSREAETEAHRR